MDKPVHTARLLLIRLLGPCRAETGAGIDVTPKTRKARALLAILAVEKSVMTRDRLADMLWSDRGADQARASLRQAAFELRRLEGIDGALISSRDTMALDQHQVRTDLSAIVQAAHQDDATTLIALLSNCSDGLLSDLDGLDPQFDSWLRQHRANQPATALAGAIACAERLLDRGDVHGAAAIVAQVERIDPAQEEATRLGLKIAHRQGDMAALNRQYQHLCRALRDEFDAEPSAETQALFAGLSKGTTAGSGEVKSAILPGESAVPTAVEHPRNGARPRFLPAALAVAILAAVAWWSWQVGQAQGPADKPLVAVLPFEQYPSGDNSLADGIWDDTRQTLSRAQVVRVLGRSTSEAFAARDLTPAEYRRMLDVDYVLDGGVRRHGDRVRVTVSLVRTDDGVAMWEQAFDGRLGDPLALQGAIANGIEGRIRGRLASGGGARADQIPTTPAVYELYSRSRHLLKSRTGANARQALTLLDRAVAADPNFAPAWALSASAEHFAQFDSGAGDWHKSAQFKAQRAINLAPNLAEAHAARALIEGLSTPQSLNALAKATRLDPGYADAWLWLGNAYASTGKTRAAERSYLRALAIDPLLSPALENLVGLMIDHDDRRGLDALKRRLRRGGFGDTLVPGVDAQIAFRQGRLAAGMKMLLPLLGKTDLPPYTRSQAVRGLIAIGYADQSVRLAGVPKSFADLLTQRTVPDFAVDPRGRMLRREMLMLGGRAAINMGRPQLLVDPFHHAYSSVSELAADWKRNNSLIDAAPVLAVALAQRGAKEEADELLALAHAEARRRLGREEAKLRPEDLVLLAKLNAASGHRDQALRQLGRAVNGKWLPDGLMIPTDLNQEPSFRSLRNDERFRVLRAGILASVEHERRELGALPG